jgi:hypothetical protein
MNHKFIFTMVLAAGLGAEVVRADDTSSLRSLEQQLAAVLRWEILWNDSPAGFQIPTRGAVKFVLHWRSDSLSYCSRDVGVCARYKIEPQRNWAGVAHAKRDGKQSDQDALLAFDGDSTSDLTSQSTLAVGRGGLTGFPAPASGIVWTATIGVAGREEIVQQYRQMHPAEIEGLKAWIISSITQGAGLKSVTIACFTLNDPMVYYYIDRPTNESVVMAAYWNKERQAWVVASSLRRLQSPERFEQMHRVIESVACSNFAVE